MRKEINVNELINKFSDMANRGSLLAKGGVSQQDLLMQIIGTIVVVAMEDDNKSCNDDISIVNKIHK